MVETGGQRGKKGIEKDQALLTGLAQNYYDHPQLLQLLVRAFLGSRRVDFTARQIYARVMQDPVLKPCYQKDIEALLDIDALMTDTSGIRAMLPGEPVQSLPKTARHQKKSLAYRNLAPGYGSASSVMVAAFSTKVRQHGRQPVLF